MKTLRLMAFSLILIILLKAISVSADPIDAPSAIRDDLYASISAEVIATTNVPSINAKYAAVFDKSNRTLLYSKGRNVRTYLSGKHHQNINRFSRS